MTSNSCISRMGQTVQWSIVAIAISLRVSHQNANEKSIFTMIKSLSFLAITLAACACAQPVPPGQISTALANVKPSVCDADSGSWKPWSINCDFDCDGSGWEIDCDCDKKNKDCSDIICKIDQGTVTPF